MSQPNYQQDQQQILPMENPTTQTPAPSSSQPKNQTSKLHALGMIVLSIVFVITLVCNVYLRVFVGGNAGGLLGGEVGGAGGEGVLDFVQYEDVGWYVGTQEANVTSQKKNQLGLNQFPEDTNKRISYGAANPIAPKLRVITITKKSTPQSPKSPRSCLITNGLTTLTTTSITTAQNLLKHEQFGRWVIFLDDHDPVSDLLWMGFINTNQRRGGNRGNRGYQYVQKKVVVDAEYWFIRGELQGCGDVVYVQHYFKISPIQSNNLINILTTKPPSTLLLYPKPPQSPLPIPLPVPHSHIPQKQLTQYLFIFSTNLLSLITPLNYAYYARYTIEEILIRPVLAIVEGSQAVVEVEGDVYQLEGGHGWETGKEFGVVQVPRQKDKRGRANSNRFKETACFVSYPLIPNEIDYESLQSYFKSLTTQTQIQHSTIIINLPHNPTTPTSTTTSTTSPLLLKVYNLLQPYSQKLNIRLRLYGNKTTPSLSVYQAAYSYCPKSSLMITSRHNVVFRGEFLGQLMGLVQAKFHYYFVAYQVVENGSTTTVGIQTPFKYYKRKFRQQMTNFESHFMELQIFKSDLFRMMYFWSLKCQEVDFYETEAAFVIPMLEMVRLSMGILSTPLFSVKKRVMGQLEKEQIGNLKLYFQWSPIPFNKLYPIAFNSLENVAFKNNPPQKIPRTIHQIWLGNKQISPFQLKLQKSLIQINKDFEVLLWRDQNITIDNFPIMYDLIHRIMQYQSYSNRSYSAPTASLIRYELLYQRGGIYIDFKTEGKKPLNPFLKYQLFFIDIDYDPNHYIYPKNVGNGIMGAMKNNYHMLLTLTELINQQKFNFKAFNFPKIVGGYILRKSLTSSELFTQVGYGFQLFSQKPGTGKPNLCSISEAPADPDQQKFKATQYLTGKVFTIMLPCKRYKEAYLILYKVLAGTWKTKKVLQPNDNNLGTNGKVFNK